MQILKNIQIEGSKQKPILVDIFYKDQDKAGPLVIFAHGFKGFKDWGHFDFVAKAFAENGFTFVKFNFSYNGTTPENPDQFNDLEAFGENNYVIELNDLGKVIDWSLNSSPVTTKLNGQVFLIGHSRGGGISILKAAEDERVTGLVTWASVSDFLNRNSADTIRNWKEMGVIHTLNGRTKQQMPLYYQFYETIQNNPERLDISKAAKKLSIPFLIVHASDDEAVQIREAEELHKACKHSKLYIPNGGGHTFGGYHPFKENQLPDSSQDVVDRTIDFLRKI